jgi:hypothetical protein
MYPKGTTCGAPMDKFFAHRDLNQIYLFLDEHWPVDAGWLFVKPMRCIG